MIRREARRAVCALAVAALAFVPVAHGEKGDRDKPIYYQGDTGGANLSTKDGELVGNVVITQGTMTIHADRILFHQNPDNSLSATAYGNPVSFREKRDGVDEYYEGYAQRAVYDGQKRLLELFDRALLKKSNDEIRSNYISYNAGTEVFKAEGRPDARPTEAGETPLGARVRGVFQPQAKEEKTDKATPSKVDKSSESGQDKTARDAAVSKPGNPLPLKADDSISPKPGK